MTKNSLNNYKYMTQGERVLEYLKDHDTISPMEAFSKLGITKLATRVSELQKDGYTFKKEWCDSKNRFGERVRYMVYSQPKKKRGKKVN